MIIMAMAGVLAAVLCSGAIWSTYQQFKRGEAPPGISTETIWARDQPAIIETTTSPANNMPPKTAKATPSSIKPTTKRGQSKASSIKTNNPTTIPNTTITQEEMNTLYEEIHQNLENIANKGTRH